MRWGKEMSLRDWIELTERNGPAIWRWLRNQWFGFVAEASERLEELEISLMRDRFTRLKDECRPQYIKHFENQVTSHMESGWLVYGLPSIERWLESAGGDFGNLTVHKERQILKWRNRQVRRRVKGYGRLDP